MAEREVLIDTSIWISYFRKDQLVYQKVNKLIDDDRVCCTNLIVAELVQGSKSEKEINVIKDFLDVFQFLKERDDTWLKAAYLSFRLRKKGKTVGLADCYLAQTALENDVSIFAFD